MNKFTRTLIAYVAKKQIFPEYLQFSFAHNMKSICRKIKRAGNFDAFRYTQRRLTDTETTHGEKTRFKEAQNS